MRHDKQTKCAEIALPNARIVMWYQNECGVENAFVIISTLTDSFEELVFDLGGSSFPPHKKKNYPTFVIPNQ